MVKRGHEVEIEYSKKQIMERMNTFFQDLVVEKIKFASFNDEIKTVTKNKDQKISETNSKYHKKISGVKNEKIKKSLIEFTKVFKKK
jgi:hypothetical protein